LGLADRTLLNDCFGKVLLVAEIHQFPIILPPALLSGLAMRRVQEQTGLTVPGMVAVSTGSIAVSQVAADWTARLPF
jgi:hypothetical protein